MTTTTERVRDRTREDASFVPTILKRVDTVRRHPDDVLELAISEGLQQIRRPSFSLVLSSLAAGLILGFSGMSVAVVSTIVHALDVVAVERIATAAVYPLGFVICILSGTQLFTEHTALAVYPVLDGRASRLNLARLWFLVICGNLAGAAISAGLFASADTILHARDGFLRVGDHLVGFTPRALLVSAMLAGWLMAQGSWLVLASTPGITQLVSIYIVTFLIGIGGLHHSIAGAVELFTAILLDPSRYSFAQALRSLGIALIGNLLGGSVFVALLNYAHIRQTQTAEPDEG
ncbi:MAG: formate/nitrite transporter family protein [Bdellovibrionales bacterium]|nr:formate/nitrite transporter family protein [Bdellovibrionales bacterium]